MKPTREAPPLADLSPLKKGEIAIRPSASGHSPKHRYTVLFQDSRNIPGLRVFDMLPEGRVAFQYGGHVHEYDSFAQFLIGIGAIDPPRPGGCREAPVEQRQAAVRAQLALLRAEEVLLEQRLQLALDQKWSQGVWA